LQESCRARNICISRKRNLTISCWVWQRRLYLIRWRTPLLRWMHDGEFGIFLGVEGVRIYQRSSYLISLLLYFFRLQGNIHHLLRQLGSSIEYIGS
jgi:hypothetical protein